MSPPHMKHLGLRPAGGPPRSKQRGHGASPARSKQHLGRKQGTSLSHSNSPIDARHGSPEKIFPPDDESSWFSKKRAYLAHARAVSYAMQGKSAGGSALAWVEDLWGDSKSKKPARVQSFLGGAFLRMYLDHEVDPDVIKRASVEIAESPEFANLQTQMNAKCQAELAQAHARQPVTEAIKAIYAKDLNRVREKSGIAFRYTLNAVIGGVTGVSVKDARILASRPKGGSAGANAEIDYEVDVVFSDTYDFENRRTGVYETYRKRLAHLLALNDFTAFEAEYGGELLPTGKTNLDSAAIFASFMYALEKKGWTPGPLAWEVSVPMRGTTTVPATRPPR
jgi:hypothetical protein